MVIITLLFAYVPEEAYEKRDHDEIRGRSGREAAGGKRNF
jgi:hypothetical protein